MKSTPLPLGSAQMPMGFVNCADAAGPSWKPWLPLPARVCTWFGAMVTVPKVTLTVPRLCARMRWLDVSAMKTTPLPLGSAQMPMGLLNCADAAGPSWKPWLPVPASVCTTRASPSSPAASAMSGTGVCARSYCVAWRWRGGKSLVDDSEIEQKRGHCFQLKAIIITTAPVKSTSVAFFVANGTASVLLVAVSTTTRAYL